MNDKNQPQIGLIGKAGSGKDAFVIALNTLTSIDGVDVIAAGFEKDANGRVLKDRLKEFDARRNWVNPTEKVDLNSFLINRRSVYFGQRAFNLSAELVNTPGAVFNLIRKKELNISKLMNSPSYINEKAQSDIALLEELKQIIEQLVSMSIYVVMLDIAPLLVTDQSSRDVLGHQSEDLEIIFSGLFDYLLKTDGKHKRFVYCISKIDGKFLGADSGNAREVSEALETVYNLLYTDKFTYNDDIAIDEFTFNVLLAAVDTIKRAWKGSKREDLYQLSLRNVNTPITSWKRSDFKHWFSIITEQLSDGLLDNEQTMILGTLSSEQLEQLIKDKLPGFYRHVIYKTPNRTIFAISATGSDLTPRAERGTINIHRVLNYLLVEMDTIQQQHRQIPFWLRSITRFIRKHDLPMNDEILFRGH